MRKRRDNNTRNGDRQTARLRMLAVLMGAYSLIASGVIGALALRPEWFAHFAVLLLPVAALLLLTVFTAILLYRAAVPAPRPAPVGRPPARAEDQYTMPLDGALVNRLSDGILSVDDGGVIRFANSGAARLFDQPADTLLGMRLPEVMPIPFASEASDSVAEVLSEFVDAPAGERPRRVVGLRGGQTVFPVELTVDSVPRGERTGFLVTVRDVSERRKADNLATRLGRLLDNAGEEVYIFDDQTLHFSDVNLRAINNLGYTRERLFRSRPTDIAPELSTQAFENMLADLRDGHSDHLTYQTAHRRADGSEYPVEVTLSFSRDEEPPVFMAIAEDISVRRSAEERLQFIAHHDPLTELPNRMLFMDRLERAILSADRNGECVTLMFVDLDLFKRVNDTLGHDTGDALLKAVGQRLREQVRVTDTVARLAGDEFTVLLTGVHDRTDAERVASKILHAFEAPIRIGDHDIVIGMSIGLTIYPADASSPTQLLHHADEAMYAVKKAGRGDYRVYEPEQMSAVERRQRMEHALRNAIALDELEVSFEPVMDVVTGETIAGSAGIQWEAPGGEKIATAEIMRCAQQIGMLENIELWLMRAACEQHARWASASATPPSVFVGLSTWQLRRRDFTAQVDEVLERYDVDAGSLVIGLMEGGLLDVLEGVTAGFDVLRDLGVRFNVVGFGSGYQRLGRMRNFPVDYLSLPEDLVAELPDQQAVETLSPLTVTGDSLASRVIAPGVQSAGAREALVAMGCQLMHGPAIAPVRSADAFLRQVRDASGPLRLVKRQQDDVS